MIYNVVLVSVTAKWFSYIYIYIFFYINFHYGLLQHIEHSSLCYTAGPCCLSILYIIVCICQSETPNPSLHHPPSSYIFFFKFLRSFLFLFWAPKPFYFSLSFDTYYFLPCIIIYTLFLCPHWNLKFLVVPWLHSFSTCICFSLIEAITLKIYEN